MVKRKDESPGRPGFQTFCNHQAERAVIASLLANPSKVLKHVSTMGLQPFMFTDPVSTYAFKAIRSLASKGKPIDPILVQEEIATFPDDGPIKAQEFSACDWPKSSTSHDTVCHHIGVVMDKHQRQEAVWFMEDAIGQLNENVNSQLVLGTLRENLLTVMRGHSQEKDRSHEEVVENILAECTQAKETGSFGVPVPWEPLKNLIAGLPKGKVTIVAGRPKQGKSTFANALASHNAWAIGSPTGVWSMEMTKEEWIKTMVGARFGIDCFKMKTGRYTNEEFSTFRKGLIEAGKIPLYINDKPQTIHTLCADIREQVTERELTLVVIDYMTCLKEENRPRNMTRQEVVAQWSNALTTLAKDCPNTAFVVVCQLKRLERDEDSTRRPILQDLRESGAIEQDAYMVIFVYPDPHSGGAVIPDNAPTVVELAATRGGRSGCYTTTFEKSKQRFV